MHPLAEIPLHSFALRLRDLPASTRSGVVTDGPGRMALLDALRTSAALRGAVVLGTCSRLELYLTGHPTGGDPWPVVRRVLAEHLGAGVATDAAWTARRGTASAAHLLRVTCGLDSPILGDTQVLGQVRQAFTESLDRASIDPVLYDCSDGHCSSASGRGTTRRSPRAASASGPRWCDLIEARQGSGAHDARVLLVGAGDAAASILAVLVSRGFSNLTIVNRSRTRARALAADAPGAKVRPIGKLADAVARADVIIGAVAAPVALLDADVLRPTARRRLVIDVAQPRCTAPDLRCDVVTLDDLVDRPPPARLAAVPVVEQACEAATAAYAAWFAMREVDGALRDLYRDVDDMIGQVAIELRSVDARDEVDRVLRRRLRAALHPHIHELRRITADLATAGAASAAAEANGAR